MNRNLSPLNFNLEGVVPLRSSARPTSVAACLSGNGIEDRGLIVQRLSILPFLASPIGVGLRQRSDGVVAHNRWTRTPLREPVVSEGEYGQLNTMRYHCPLNFFGLIDASILPYCEACRCVCATRFRCACCAALCALFPGAFASTLC